MKTKRRDGWSVETLEPGRVVEFEYPARNYFGVPLEYVNRRVVVREVVDLHCSPIYAADILERPLLRRGSILLVGHDIDLDREGKYYLAAMRDGGELASFRLGLYDPAEPHELVDWIERVYRPNRHDCQMMIRTVERFTERLLLDGPIDLELGAFAVRGR